ncbi:MAG: hypothetical protein QNK37_14330 [Acidobacteriota bacterium]|nr:hypothetical protein [Acidobacteriota bacterium]
MKPVQWVFLLLMGSICIDSPAQLVIDGADGSDGALEPTADITIDLDDAATNAWNATNTSPGRGTYDAAKWAVVFRYDSVMIPEEVTVSFSNHASRAPVVWLVSGDVVIDGVVDLNAFPVTLANPNPQTFGEPGPGGFRGGYMNHHTFEPGPGFGPGGGALAGNASYGTEGIGNTATYGNTQIVPLIGGSGAGAHFIAGSGPYIGEGGGGAILIAARGTITVNGQILARGRLNLKASSGGAVRLVADEVNGAGLLDASGGNGGGMGRIRVEANVIEGTLQSQPGASVSEPDDPPLIWPQAGSPTLRIVSIAGIDAPPDPRANMDLPGADVQIGEDSPVDIVIESRGLAVDAVVTVRLVSRRGQAIIAEAAFDSGTMTQATWIANVSFPSGYTAIQVKAVTP